MQFRPCAMEKEKVFKPPLTLDGHPDLQGYWADGRQAFDIEAHSGRMGVTAETTMIVDPPDGRIPYQPWAAARHKDISEKIDDPPTLDYIDPNSQCFMRGVPRQTYSPFPIQISQTSTHLIILHEQNHAYQIIPVNEGPHIGSAIRLWMGDSRGHWEGNTLVVDTTNQNGQAWLDEQGNIYSDQTHVVQRFTLVDADTIHFEATIDDPGTYTRPWTLAFPLRRNKEAGFEIIEFACHEGNRTIELQLRRPDKR